MKKLTLILSALVISASVAFAQSNPLNIAVQGGVLGSGNENAGLFFDNSQASDLITPQFGVSVGYDFASKLGTRVAVSFGKNVGSNAKLDTYKFQSINAFADLLYTFTNNDAKFTPKVYVGIGGAQSSNFSDIPSNLKGKLDEDNLVFGARVGVNVEYKLFEKIGVFGDLNLEGYQDAFNGQKGGRSYELRSVASLGIILHF